MFFRRRGLDRAYLNEVLSIRAQEWDGTRPPCPHHANLNEVLSIRAQE